MARRGSRLQAMVRAQREAEKTRAAAAKSAEKARKEDEKAQVTEQKEQARLYTESRAAQVQWQNEQLEQQIQTLEHMLSNALSVDPSIDIQSLKQTPQIPPFNPGPLAVAEPPPQPDMYAPPAPTGLQKLLPGAKDRYAQEVAKAQEVYQMYVALRMLLVNGHVSKLLLRRGCTMSDR